MITPVNLVKNNSVYFKGSNTEIKPVSNSINQDTTADKVDISNQKNKKTAKKIGYFIGAAIFTGLVLRRPIKNKIRVEKAVSAEVSKYKTTFEKTKVAARKEVKDILEKSEKDSSVVDKLTDGEVNTIVAAKNSLVPAAIPLLITYLAKTPDFACQLVPVDSEEADEFKSYLLDLEKTSDKPLQYVDYNNQYKYKFMNLDSRYGYLRNPNFDIIDNTESYFGDRYDVRHLGIVLDRDKVDYKKYPKSKKAAFAAVIINNVLYRNGKDKEKEQLQKVSYICKNNENNEKRTHKNNCDFIANDVREKENKQIEIEEKNRRAKIRKEIFSSLDALTSFSDSDDDFDDMAGYYDWCYRDLDGDGYPDDMY